MSDTSKAKPPARGGGYLSPIDPSFSSQRPSQVEDPRELTVREVVLTAEEIAVLTGRDGVYANPDKESDFLDDAPEFDRMRAAGDPGGIDGSLGFDVIEIGGGDDKLVGGGMRVVAEAAVMESKPDASVGNKEADVDAPSGVDIINLSAAEDEWVPIARREVENSPSTDLDGDPELAAQVLARHARIRDRCRARPTAGMSERRAVTRK